MVSKKELERLDNLEKRIKEMEAKKQQLEARISEKARKERTKRLIEVGAIFEKYFDIDSKEDAEKIAFCLRERVEKQKAEMLKLDIEKSLEKNELIFEEGSESLIIPKSENIHTNK